MVDNSRILAVKMQPELFDELKAHVKEAGLTTQKFINDLVEEKLNSMKLTQEIQQNVWEQTDVAKAIDDFIVKNGRVPSQKEYRNDNGLPSYKAAGRCLDMSPAVYGQQRLEELLKTNTEDFNQPADEQNNTEPIIGM